MLNSITPRVFSTVSSAGMAKKQSPVSFAGGESSSTASQVSRNTGLLKKIGFPAVISLSLTACPSGDNPDVEKTVHVNYVDDSTNLEKTVFVDYMPSGAKVIDNSGTAVPLLQAAKDGKLDYDGAAQGPPTRMSWIDKASANVMTAVRSDDGTDPNYLKYDVTGANGVNGVQEYFNTPDGVKIKPFNSTEIFKMQIDSATGNTKLINIKLKPLNFVENLLIETKEAGIKIQRLLKNAPDKAVNDAFRVLA